MGSWHFALLSDFPVTRKRTAASDCRTLSGDDFSPWSRRTTALTSDAGSQALGWPKKQLGWTPDVNFKQLVTMMVDADLARHSGQTAVR